MDEPDLLIMHTERWATEKGRSVDGDLLKEIVHLRLQYDELPLGAWPGGSAERLLLVTWPAYGPQPPDPDGLRETLDTFWGFLRATGRMAGGSATPAELRKEARRALPKMAAACEDPANHAQGRVLGNFGRSIGVDLDGAADVADLEARMAQVTEAWNALPTEERVRLMPDPSPKSLMGQQMTAIVNRPRWPEPGPDDDFDAEIEPGDVKVSAELARTSAFVAACLALVEWLGQGKPVTTRGLLRPPVAREAYRQLDLWQWERRFEAVKRASYGLAAAPMSAEADAVLADAALNSWRSAGDCLALDRLWYACDAADQVALTRSTARRGQRTPETDEEWRDLALVLLLGLCLRLGWYVVEPMAGLLLLAAVADDEVPFHAVRAWWDSRCPETLRNFGALGWQERLDLLMFHFEDANLWTFVDDHYTLTDLGRDFATVFVNAVDSGLLGDD